MSSDAHAPFLVNTPPGTASLSGMKPMMEAHQSWQKHVDRIVTRHAWMRALRRSGRLHKRTNPQNPLLLCVASKGAVTNEETAELACAPQPASYHERYMRWLTITLTMALASAPIFAKDDKTKT